MQLKEIVAITGKPGLYKVVAQSNRGYIVESIDEKKARMPVSGNQQVAMVDEITIYTTADEPLPLRDVFKAMHTAESSGSTPAPNDSPARLREYFNTVAPGHDEERVYASDIKKIVKWYQVLRQNMPSDFWTDKAAEAQPEDAPKKPEKSEEA